MQPLRSRLTSREAEKRFIGAETSLPPSPGVNRKTEIEHRLYRSSARPARLPGRTPMPDQLGLEARPTRRAMTMAGKRMPKVDRNAATILAEVFTAKTSPNPTVVSEVRLK